MLLNDLVKYDCQDGRVPACQEDPTESWMTAQQFYAGLGIVQVRAPTGGREEAQRVL